MKISNDIFLYLSNFLSSKSLFSFLRARKQFWELRNYTNYKKIIDLIDEVSENNDKNIENSIESLQKMENYFVEFFLILARINIPEQNIYKKIQKSCILYDMIDEHVFKNP